MASMIYLHALGAAIVWPILFVVRICVQLVGLLVVTVALPFAYEVPSDRVPSWELWRCIRLPKWAWLWCNIRDGAMGDVRGKYWHVQAPAWAKTDFLKMWNWLALRNPCNNFSRWIPVMSVDVTGRRVQVISEGTRHRFLFVRGKYNIPYWHLCFKIKEGLFANLGHKIKLKHNGKDWSNDPQKARIGFTFRPDDDWYN